ncbi:MAG: 6-bladed beta-propeller [Bacteroidota bacterium]
MKILLSICIGILLIGCQTKQSAPKLDTVDAIQVDSLGVIPDGVLLGPADHVEIQDERFYWVEQEKIIVATHDGTIDTVIKAHGKGPGEFEIISAFSSSGKRLVVFDEKQQKMLLFGAYGSEFRNEFKVDDTYRFKNITLTEDGIYAQVEWEQGQQDASVIKYDFDGQREKILGNIPATASLQAVRNGGGIAADKQENVYASYIGSRDIFYRVGNAMTRMELELPSYTAEAKVSNIKLDSRQPIDYIRYSFEISRTMGIHRLNENQIVQAIELGNPWKDEAIRIIGRVINLENNRSINYEFDHRIMDVHDGKVYTLAQNVSDQENWDASQEYIKLIDVYELGIEKLNP